MPTKPRTHWWKLYASLPAMSGLFLVEGRLRLPAYGHMLLQLLILAVVYEFIRRWLRANTRALAAHQAAPARGVLREQREREVLPAAGLPAGSASRN
jgi:hypothetical protein